MSAAIAHIPVSNGQGLPRPVAPAEESAAQVRAKIEEGTIIRNLRIRSGEELEAARQRKLAWTQQVIELLRRQFQNDAVIEEFTTWEGRVLPEFADGLQFVAHFREEMDRRLAKLRRIHRHLHALAVAASSAVKIGRAHVCTPVTVPARMPSSA